METFCAKKVTFELSSEDRVSFATDCYASFARLQDKVQPQR